MASTNIGKWNIQTSLDASGITSGTKEITAAASGINKSFAIINTGATSLVNNFRSILGGAGIAGFLGSGLIGSAVSGLLEFSQRGDQVAKSQRHIREEFQLSREDAAGAIQLGRELGRSSEETGSLLAIAARHMGQLSDALEAGEHPAAERALARLNIEARDWVRLPVPQAIAQVGDQMDLLGSGTERAAALTAIFGRNYHQLMQDLERGSAGLSGATGRAFVTTAEDESIIRAGGRIRNEGSAFFSRMWDQFGTILSREQSRFQLNLLERSLGRDAVNRFLQLQRPEVALGGGKALQDASEKTDIEIRHEEQRRKLAQAEQERIRAERGSMQLLQLQQFETTPFDRVQARMREITRAGEFLTDRQRGAALLQAFGGALPREAQMLGGLEANTAETAAVLQQAMMPEIDQMAAVNAMLESIYQDALHKNEINEQTGREFERIRIIIEDMANSLGAGA